MNTTTTIRSQWACDFNSMAMTIFLLVCGAIALQAWALQSRRPSLQELKAIEEEYDANNIRCTEDDRRRIRRDFPR